MKQIPLSGETGEGKFALVDDEDYPILSRMTWNLTDHGYARNDRFDMHVLIMGFPKQRLVDHRDRNTLNNQKSNLRVATHQKNQMNQGKRAKSATSIYKGVCCRKRPHRQLTKPWLASITKTEDGKKKTHFLGYYATETEAALAYDLMAQLMYGEFACLNFPLTDTASV